MSQGKARLLLGTTCVGLLVVAAVVLLGLNLIPSFFLVEPKDTPTEFFVLFAWFMMIAIVMIPFDILGGLVIPSKFELRPLEKSLWFKKWSFSVLLQVLFYTITFFIYLQIGRSFGTLPVIATFIVMQTLLLGYQQRIWQIVSSNSSSDRSTSSADFVSNHDHRFTGGVMGLPGFETTVVPLSWQNELSTESLHILVTRRLLAIQSGGRWRGILIAMGWNTSSLLLAVFMTTSAFSSVASMITLFLWNLLFSFIGLLALPALNRSSVFALDSLTASKADQQDLKQAIAEIDQMTEQDPSRDVSSESVFQPIPCPERRIEALERGGTQFVPAWNVARTALYLSCAFGGPLSRAVHCNVGRPELWASLPTD